MKKLGKYTISGKLGNGGNGIVHEVTDDKGNVFALKTLLNFSRSSSYPRFRDEIHALTHMKGVVGIVDIIDYHLPNNASNDNLPYYVMEKGVPLIDYLKGTDHRHLFSCFLKIVQGVVNLHDQDFTHRDIKPNNMLVVNEEPVLCDFGLVSFPNKSNVSEKNEKIGAKWTIAPEMQRTSSTAEYKRADVYSLAKSLWILITNVDTGFEGQYILNSNISIDKYVDVKINTRTVHGKWYYNSLVLLERLLVKSTDNNPENRPSALEFLDSLEEWIAHNEDYFLRNPVEWADALNKIFPYGTPEKAEWKDNAILIKILNIITSYDSSNYTFFPFRGGDDLKSISYSSKNGYVVINETEIMSVNKLMFFSLGDPDWSYFRLVLNDLTHITKDEEPHREDYRADHDFNFLGDASDYSIYGEVVSRYLKGSLIIVLKTGKINNLTGTYKSISLNGHSGIHDKLSYEEYNEVLAECRRKDMQKINYQTS